MIRRHHMTFSDDFKKKQSRGRCCEVSVRSLPHVHTCQPGDGHLTQPSSTGSRFKPLPPQVATVGSAVFSRWRFSNNRRVITGGQRSFPAVERYRVALPSRRL